MPRKNPRPQARQRLARLRMKMAEKEARDDSLAKPSRSVKRSSLFARVARIFG
jgi:hypothetical protein